MKLKPLQPPGRISRKVRAYASDIKQLREMGYTIEAIQQALAEAGVPVSKSTVQREAARRGPVWDEAHDSRTRTDLSPDLRQEQKGTAEQRSASAQVTHTGDLPSSKEIAAAFVRTRINNPLLRKQEP